MDHNVEFAPLALEQLAFLESHAVTIRAPIEDVLRLGAYPHPYRRIKPKGKAWVLAYKAWRIDFASSGLDILVTAIHTGYRPAALLDSNEPDIELHREFTRRFGEV